MKGPKKRTKKGKEKPYIHSFRKSEPGQITKTQDHNEVTYSADIFDEFLMQVKQARDAEEVEGERA